MCSEGRKVCFRAHFYAVIHSAIGIRLLFGNGHLNQEFKLLFSNFKSPSSRILHSSLDMALRSTKRKSARFLPIQGNGEGAVPSLMKLARQSSRQAVQVERWMLSSTSGQPGGGPAEPRRVRFCKNRIWTGSEYIFSKELADI